jgi:REP element-mobilizing transposase RayT
MPSTHLSLNFHVIFSTRDREPAIAADWRAGLHAYLGGCIQGVGGQPLTVGGTADHVHLLMRLRATHCLADVLREIKAGSSRWVHEQHSRPAFAWQDGYAGLTVSPSGIAPVFAYIERQEARHRRKTFKEEYVEFLRKSGIEYDERYLW